MEQRTRTKLRRLIELCVEAVARGSMPLSKAAEMMEAVGAPFEVVCRVLMPYKDGVPQGASAPGGEARYSAPTPGTSGGKPPAPAGQHAQWMARPTL